MRGLKRRSVINNAVNTAIEPLERRVLFTVAFQQDAGTNALVVMEAESADAKVSVGGKSWTAYTGVAGYAGTGTLRALPNTGTLIDTGYATTSPRLDFVINFAKTGTHYVWIRGVGGTTDDDSLHVGLDGAAVASADRVQLTSNNQYGWSGKTMDAGAVATVNVTTAGLHTLNLWMREDGAAVDRLLLSNSASYVPTGTGPAVSARADVPTTSKPTVTLVAMDASASESAGNPGAFTFTRTGGDSSQPLVVKYTVSGTATNGTDYPALGGSVTIAAGAPSAVVNIMPTDDSLVESSETVTLTLATDATYALGSSTFGTATSGADALWRNSLGGARKD